jgi:hypothetical protein
MTIGNKQPPSELTKLLAADIARWSGAPSFRRGFAHLAGRRYRLEKTCEKLLAATPKQFAYVMNTLRPGQYVRYEMTETTAAKLLRTMTVGGLADMVEAALDCRPTDVNVRERFDALRRVEVQGYGRGASSLTDRILRSAQEARRWLGQSKGAGRPKKCK